ncbi:cation diffusion facilitator family transporter [Snodgrassella sp. ESL0253]|uniref:cation diffusion facilitator family transporter n=1 Tax=Snodgrassella sp. ESL0253 TaxID=2705031 RepID=UPI001582793D|nr:cation diffusion facilitator family transporter [Snodgrassella sp. ESL0253]NUE67201.1 cation transporter [Snodgrassella sp. ESL0253]
MHEHNHTHEHHHDGAHHHHIGAHSADKQVLRISLLVIGAYMVVEIIGGYFTNSLALLSDAGHMFSDALALALSLIAFHLSERPVNQRQTFGYKRFEIIAAAVNGMALIAIAVMIVYEAIGRFVNPPDIATRGMLIISVLGLLVNIAIAWYMYRTSETEHNVNMRGAFLHVLGDLLGSVGAIVAAILMMLFGWRWADPLASIVVACLIAYSGIGILKTTLRILMEGTPDAIELEQLSNIILAMPGIEAVHDLHAWTITSNMNALSCHIVVDGALTVTEAEKLVNELAEILLQHNIHHVTVQTESTAHTHSNNLLCCMPSGAHQHAH